LQHILSIQNISKSYGKIQALKNVSFTVPPGSVFGILGPNGSGKTTLLGIVLDVLKSDAGNYTWLENDNANDARKQIGSLLETPNFYHYLSAVNNLEIAATIKQRGRDDIDRVLEKVNLLQRKDSAFQTYSLGMKQRLAIASTLLGNPKVLVFDEPTNGLDPAGIAEIRELIRQLNAEGYTIIMASHLLDEVEKVCTHVAILKHGNLLLSGPVNEVLHNDDVIEVGAGDMDMLQAVLTSMQGVKDLKRYNGIFIVACDDGMQTTHVNKYCSEKGIVLSHLAMKKKSLETKFMELTNN
jgi:ABC-type multidrug transport system ATPase subunit